jgi:hypothetical protein
MTVTKTRKSSIESTWDPAADYALPVEAAAARKSYRSVAFCDNNIDVCIYYKKTKRVCDECTIGVAVVPVGCSFA